MTGPAQGVPAIDHHSHASAYRSGGTYRSVRDHEDHFLTGHLEANVPSEAYRSYVRARNAGDAVELDRLEEAHGIAALLETGRQYRSTTFFTTALRKGCALLYGTDEQDRFEALGARLRAEGLAAPYDRAAEVAGTPVILADVPKIDRGAWNPETYRQVIRIDPYFYPFGLEERDDRGTEADRFLGIFRTVLDEQRAEHGLDELPATFDEYRDFCLASLRERREGGAIGYKIVSAYVRTLAFDRVGHAEAAAAYASLRTTGDGDRKALADHLVAVIAAEAGELGIPIQIHTGMGHPEPGMYIRNADPLNLEKLLLAPELNRTRFVMIHGAYPYSSSAAALAQTYGNVFLDFSWMPYLHHEHLRLKLVEWLEILPANKLIFGTDTGLPEFHVAAAHFAREALDHALESGVSRGVWTAAQTDYLARRVLYDNTADLYGIEGRTRP